jgi:glycosyltransferase involved in cell wall biosynthesis
MTLLQAMVLLEERLPDLTLLVAGEFWGDKNQYLEFIEQNRLAQRVRVIEGYVPNEALGIHFSACDLVVLPYTEATQSGVIQLAFSLGVPVVSTRVGGLAEMVDHGRTGLLVKPHDPQAIAEAVTRFFIEPGLAEAMRSAIRRTAGQNTWAGLVAQVEQIASILG